MKIDRKDDARLLDMARMLLKSVGQFGVDSDRADTLMDRANVLISGVSPGEESALRKALLGDIQDVYEDILKQQRSETKSETKTGTLSDLVRGHLERRKT